MKLKNLFFLLVFLIILGMTGYILWEQKQEQKIPEDKNFAVKHPGDLVKIFLADKHTGETILLEKQGKNKWMLNGEYRAMPEKVDMLLGTLKSIKVNHPVPESQWDFVVKDLATNSVKVELYKEEGKPFKTYFVGRAPANSMGGFMIMQKNGVTAKRPYVCHIPGYVAELKSRFFTDELEWRDLNVFRYKMDDIKEVSMYYPRNPEHSFRIRQDDEEVVLSPYSDSLPQIDGKVNEAMIIEYLDFFSRMNAEGFAVNYEKKDSILGTTPAAVIEVKGKGDRQDRLEIFYMPLNKRSAMQYDPMGNEIMRDQENYYALRNGQDFLTIQQFVFGKTFRKYPQFFL